MNYYRRYIGDFQRDTGHLSLTEVGAYDRLLDHYYATEASLPVSLETLCRISRAVTREERDAVQMVADKFFPLVEGERRNKRADKEIAAANSARNNGKKGGNPWVKDHYNEPGFVYAVRGQEERSIKIGITIDPRRRISEHKRYNGCRDTVLVVQVEQMGISEQAILTRFKEYADGEWLTLPSEHEPALLAFMKRMAVPGSVPTNEGESVPERAPGSVGHRPGDGVAKTVHPPTTNHQPPAFNLQEPTTKPPKVKSAGRGSRLPAAWEPDAEQVKFCRQERPDLLPAATAARFRDYWIAQPGAKGVKLDWSATWRNWVRNEKRGANHGQSLADRNRAAGEEAQRRFEEEQRERR